MVHLITGYAGQGHVTAADDALYHAGVCGTGKYVMRTGTMFRATVETNNSVKIGSGDLINQGRHINIPTNGTETATIQNGTQGQTRRDIIAIRYSQDTSTSIESASLVVIKGTPVTTGQTPADPAIRSGNLYNGEDVDDFPLYRVTLKNLEIEKVEPMFTMLPQLSGLINMIYPVGSIYMSVNATDPGTLFGGTWQRIQDTFLMAAGANHAAGSTGGAENVTLSADQMPSHTHTGPSHTHTGPSHTHTLASHAHTASSASAGAHTHTVPRNKNAASGTARYAAHAADSGTSHNTASNGAHTHTITVNGSGNLTTAAAGTGSTGAAGTGATGATGGGKAHNNMPPYLAVYVWKRTS